MKGLIHRHLQIYFSNKASVFFSLMGALINFALYLLFMKSNLASSFEGLADGTNLSNLWVLAGSLGTAAITTSLAGVGQLVTDKERQVVKDFLLTDLSSRQLYLSYLLNGGLIGFAMQLLVLLFMGGTFYLQDGLTLSLSQLALLLVLMALVSLVVSLGNLVLLFTVTRSTTLAQLSALIGTLTGFLSATYIPLGILPKLAQNLFKLSPALYISSLYRQILMAEQLGDIPTEVKKYLGLGLSFGDLLTNSWQDLALLGAWGLEFAAVLMILLTQEKKK